MKKRIVSAIICAGFCAALAVTQMAGNTTVPNKAQNTVSRLDAAEDSGTITANVPASEYDEDLVDNIEESLEVEGDTLIAPEEVPLDPSPNGKTKVTKKTSSKTVKKTQKLKKAAKKNKTVTKKTTRKQKKSAVKTKETVIKETTTVTTKKSKYKKGSVKVQITEKINTTVKTTTTPLKSTKASIRSAAPKANAKLLQRFEDEGYKFVVDTKLGYTGLFSSRNKQITMRYQSNIVYHELGHYLAYTTGKTDLSDEFIKIYNKEKNKFDGDIKDYITSNSREYFAESYRDYVTRKTTLKKKRPQTYKYIEKVLNML